METRSKQGKEHNIYDDAGDDTTDDDHAEDMDRRSTDDDCATDDHACDDDTWEAIETREEEG